MTDNALLSCQVTHGHQLLFPKTRLCVLSMAKWRNWVFGQLEPYTTAKKTLGEAMKCFEALVLVIDITNNALLQYLVTHGDCLLSPKTRFCLHPMAKRAKLRFWSTLALYHSQKDHWRGHETF